MMTKTTTILPQNTINIQTAFVVFIFHCGNSLKKVQLKLFSIESSGEIVGW